jgi:ascorbate-specific PTS system EIIC-type component UlaA
VSNSRNNNVVVIVGGVVFCFTLAACVAVFIAAPEGGNTASLIAILIGALAPTLASLGVLAKVNNTDAKVDRVADDTYRLTNGLLDAKVRAGVADAMPEHMLDPDYVEGQLHVDRRVRDEQHLPEHRRDAEESETRPPL